MPPGSKRKPKRKPFRVDELRELRKAGGLSCPGKLDWVTELGMLKPTSGEYTYTCPNCKTSGTTREYREKCGKKLQ